MIRLLMFMMLTLVWLGCGSNGGGGGAGGAGGGTAGGSGGGGTAGDGGTTAKGLVTLTQIGDSSFLIRRSRAEFYPNGLPPAECPITCTRSVVSGCDIADCFHDAGTLTPDCAPGGSAGTVTTAVTGSGGDPALVRSATTGIYQGGANGTWWAGGETVSVMATGGGAGGVPAFTSTLTAPSRITITSPTGNSPLPVTPNMPLSVTWTGTTSGSVVVGLSSGKHVGGHSVTAQCDVPASAGAFTVPASVTSLLLPTSNYNGSFYLTNTNTTTTTAGAWSIQTRVIHTPPARPIDVP